MKLFFESRHIPFIISFGSFLGVATLITILTSQTTNFSERVTDFYAPSIYAVQYFAAGTEHVKKSMIKNGLPDQAAVGHLNEAISILIKASKSWPPEYKGHIEKLMERAKLLYSTLSTMELPKLRHMMDTKNDVLSKSPGKGPSRETLLSDISQLNRDAVRQVKKHNSELEKARNGIHDSASRIRLLALFLLFSGIVVSFREITLRRLKENEEKRRILDIFGQHVSAPVVERLTNQKLSVNSEIKNVCVMFMDIKGFTSFSENKTPEEVVGYLNTLFDFMIDIVNHHHGVINKFLGDGFMAVFGAPLENENKNADAVSAALDIISRVHQENKDKKIPQTNIRIGLHSGNAVVGSVGSSLRKEYTIVGDVVNLASRIEQLNKQFGSQLLISEDVWVEANGTLEKSKPLGHVSVKGREHTIQLYQLA